MPGRRFSGGLGFRGDVGHDRKRILGAAACEIGIGRGKFMDGQEGEGLLLPIQRHELGCVGNTDAAAGAAVPVDHDGHLLPGEHATWCRQHLVERTEGLTHGLVAELDEFLDVGEGEWPDMGNRRADQQQGRCGPVVEHGLLLLMHHHGRGAHEDGCEALLGHSGGQRDVGHPHVDGNEGIHVQASNPDGEIVGGPAIDAHPIAYHARGEETGERAGGVDGIADFHGAQAWPAEDQWQAALDVHGRDQERAAKRVEGAFVHQLLAEAPEGTFEIDRPGEHALHEHAQVIDAEQVAAAKTLGAFEQFLGAASARGSGGDHGADAGTGVECRRDSRFGERSKGADMGHALEGTASQHQADLRAAPWAHGGPLSAGGVKSAVPAVHTPVTITDRFPCMRVLLVEDDDTLRESATAFLRASGLVVDSTATGKMARELAAVSPYDVVVLDIRLPDDDGFLLCTAFRERNPAPRILMATARDAVEDRIAGLDLGADDYLVKPYALGELVARLRALMRRPDHAAPTVLQVGDMVLDPATREARRGQRGLSLTAKEFAILEVLMRAPGRVLTREFIGEHAWDHNFDPMSNVIDVYIARLRRKIDAAGEPPLLATVRGTGYRLSVPPRG